MSFTGVLGTHASQPGNIELGLGLAATGNALSISEALNLSETASYPLRPESSTEAMSLTETATAGRIVPMTVSEALSFAESEPWTGPHYETATGILNLAEAATGHATTANKAISEGLVLLELARRFINMSVSDALALSESTRNPTIGADVLSLLEAALMAKADAFAEVLSFTEGVNYQGSFIRAATEAMTIVEAASFYATKSSIDCTYSPFIGASSGSITPPSATAPVLGTGTLTLTWPYAAPTTTLVLRNPDWGDDDKLTYNRLNQKTRNGTLVVFADPQWPKVKTRSFKVVGIADSLRDSLLQFLEDSLGQVIGLKDWDGRQWQGIITNPDSAVTQVGICDHQVSIDFEGDLV